MPAPDESWTPKRNARGIGGLLSTARLQAHCPIERVATESRGAEQQVLDQLRGLGYIK